MRNLADKLGEGLLDLKKYFSQQPDIIAVYIFGSFGTEYEHDFSDIDFAVIFNAGQITLRDECKIEAYLSKLLNREKIDLLNLNKAPVYLRYKAVTEGDLIYESDYIAHSDFLEKVYKWYLDYLPDHEVYQRDCEIALKEAYLKD